jgi:hypothetical protein
MTDQPLSPAAQAVLDAWGSVIRADNYGGRVEVPLAAALQAAADQVVPAEDEDVYLVPWNFTEHMRQRQDSRRQLLAIAAELANTSPPS